MVGKKLAPGIHNVNIKGKSRKVQVLSNGRWKFLKSGGARRSTRKHKAVVKVAKGGRYRRYGRRIKRSVSRIGMPGLLALGAGLSSMAMLGFFDAAGQLFKGNLSGAAGAIMSKMTPANMIGAAIMPIGVVMARKVVGPVNLFKAGRFNIRLL